MALRTSFICRSALSTTLLTLLACDEKTLEKQVKIEFTASVGDEAFTCTDSYEVLGGQAPADLRFYVSALHLIDDQGQAVALNLDENTNFQDQQFALIDFETGQGSCRGDAETNTQITGKLPAGTYSAIEFEVSVPKAINHSNPADFPSLLQSPSMAWSWLLGFKYLKAEIVNDQGVYSVLHLGSTGCSRDDATHAQGEINLEHSAEPQQVSEAEDTGQLHGKHQTMMHHAHSAAGSTGVDDSDSHQPKDEAHGPSLPLTSPPICSNPNRIKVRLDQFDLDSSRIHLDFSKIFSELNLDAEQQCHGSTEETACSTYFDNVALNLETGAATDAENIFTLR